MWLVAHTSSYEQSASYFTIQRQQEFMRSKSSLLARETAQPRHSLSLTNEDFSPRLQEPFTYTQLYDLKASRRGVSVEAWDLLGC